MTLRKRVDARKRSYSVCSTFPYRTRAAAGDTTPNAYSNAATAPTIVETSSRRTAAVRACALYIHSDPLSRRTWVGRSTPNEMKRFGGMIP